MLLIDAIIAVAVFAAIGIIGGFFRRKKTQPVAALAPSHTASDALTLEHDMSFEYVITGEAQHQTEIRNLLSADGKTPAYLNAELVPEGKQFIVRIRGASVGQLIAEDAVEFGEWLTDNDLAGQPLTCRAVVLPGKDGYCVRLDLPLENV